MSESLHLAQDKKVVREIIASASNRLKLFRSLPSNKQGSILLQLAPRLQNYFIDTLGEKEIAEFLHYADFDKAASLLRHAIPARRKKIMRNLEKDVAEKLEFFLKFRPGTAASIMDLNYVTVPCEAKFRDVLKAVGDHEKKLGKPPVVLVLYDGFLAGELPLHTIGLHKPSVDIREYVRKVPHTSYDSSEREVVTLFRTHPHSKIIVQDDDRSVLGVIYSQDVLRLLDRSSGHSLYGFAGVRKDEDINDSILQKVKNRYAWLLLNLFTVFLAALVVGLFEDTIAGFVLLAAYMPVVAGMGGNAGTQTLAVVIRGLTLGRLTSFSAVRVAGREVAAAMVNGLITGSVVTGIAVLFGQGPLLGLIVALSIVTNLVIGGIFGTFIPLIMNSLGKDPATSSSIFITTATDVCGFFVFLGLAELFLV